MIDPITKQYIPTYEEGQQARADLIKSQQSAPVLNPQGILDVTNPKNKEIGIISTDIASGMVQKDEETLKRLSGVSSFIPGTSGFTDLTKLQPGQTFQLGNDTWTKTPEGKYIPVSKQGELTSGKLPSETQLGTIKFLNSNNQTTELNGMAIMPEAYQNLLDQGYFPIEKSGDIPSWAAVGDTETGRANAELLRMKKEKDDLVAGMKSYMVSDEALNNQIKGIESLYDTRIKDMEDINNRRGQSMKTLGIRIGSRWTGGAGGVFGGIIAEEERQAVNRISELEAEKQNSITGAQNAARENNWKVYSEMVDQAEKSYKEQLDNVKKMNEKLVENNKKIKDQKIKASRDSAVSDLISQGITDPTEILDMLNFYEDGTSTGGDFTIEEIDKVIESIKKATKTDNLDGDIKEWKQLLDLGEANGGLPAGTTFMDYQKQKGESWSEPYLFAGDYVQKNTKTGEIRTAVNMPSGGEETKEDKQIKSFYDEADNLGKQIDSGSMSWNDAWNRLKIRYPQASVELMDQTLGFKRREASGQ